MIVFCRIARPFLKMGAREYPLFLKTLLDESLAEQALLESEAKLRSITENIPDLILMLNKNLDIIYISRTFTLNSNQVCGKSVYDFIPRKFHPAATTCFKYVLETGKPAKYGTEYSFENGKHYISNQRLAQSFRMGRFRH